MLVAVIFILLSTGMEGCKAQGRQTDSVYDHVTQALLWFQSSAECRALYYQAFNAARLSLDNHLRSHTTKKKRAVVMDIDDTILDDSPHSAMLLKENRLFPYRYDEWLNAAIEPPLPGAVEFAAYAASKGVALFYISNRQISALDATIRNLRSSGFPQADSSHVLLMGSDESKESRRQNVASDHEIVLLLGDNLNDLASVFEGKSVEGRAAEVDQLKDQFGSKFIVLPNPVYGAWESAVYGYRHNLSEQQKDSIRLAALSAYK